jgi:hypothetical protein
VTGERLKNEAAKRVLGGWERTTPGSSLKSKTPRR